MNEWNDWVGRIIAIAFMVIGILTTLYSHRFFVWLDKKSVDILRIAPWLNLSGKDPDYNE